MFFRANVASLARDLDLKGWVKNLPDGRVEVWVEGDKPRVEKIIEFCKKGPSGAMVEEVLVNFENLVNYKKFDILY